MRLVDSSNPDDVTRHNVRAHYRQRLVLTASVCRELQRAGENFLVGRPQSALELLGWWMREIYDLPEGASLDYAEGLDDPRLTEYADDMKRELELGAKVCAAFRMSFTDDTSFELDGDFKTIRERLFEYLAEFEG